MALDIEGLENVWLGMRADDLEEARPSATPSGYGHFSDSISEFGVGLSFDGTTFHEGQSPPARSKLRHIALYPHDGHEGLPRLIERVATEFGEPDHCFSMDRGVRTTGVYRYWASAGLLVADEIARASRPPRARRVAALSTHDGSLLSQGQYPVVSVDCDAALELPAWADSLNSLDVGTGNTF